MRCTRCDGLAVPQAVGIAPSGKVVFGYCLECLADSDCRLVEVPSRGLADLKLDFSASDRSPQSASQGASSPTPIDHSRYIVGAVASMMIVWGFVVLTAGLAMAPRSGPEASPFGNGTTALLGIGGVVTTLLGLALLVLDVRQSRPASLRHVTVVGWIAYVTAVGLLLYGIVDYQPRRNVPLVLGVGAAILVAIVTRVLERSQGRAPRPIRPSPPWKIASAPGKTGADGPRPLL
jgi:hypothetical protein